MEKKQLKLTYLVLFQIIIFLKTI